MDAAEHLSLQMKMIRALEGGDITKEHLRRAAYERAGIDLDDVTESDFHVADQEAYSITLLKRLT